MLEWTGERFLPWIRGSTLAYEHLHRYAYASMLVKGKRVLDLACGEGYGSKMLAASASSVVGIDIDENVVRHATAKYGSTNLQFRAGSITAVPVVEAHSFDVVVCFEAIEHIDAQEELLTEVKRLLNTDGIFLVSTPNKAIYHDASSVENPFHVKELYFEEFRELLGRYFRNLLFFGQRIHPGSSIWPIGAATTNGFHEFVMERGSSDFELVSPDKRVPLYFVAVASDANIVSTPSASVLVDESDGLFVELDQERIKQVTEREDAIKSLEEAVTWREVQNQDLTAQTEELTKGLEWMRKLAADQEKTIAAREEALTWRAGQVEELQNAKQYWERESAARTGELQNTREQLASATNTLNGIYSSRSWKLLMKLRGIRDSLKALVKSRG